MSSICGELSIWHSPWPCIADLFLISTALSCTCMSLTLLVEVTMVGLGEDYGLSDKAPAELTSLQLFSSSTELSTPKPKMMKGAKATGLNLPRLLNLQVLFAMMRSSYPMDMGFLLLAMVCMMTLT